MFDDQPLPYQVRQNDDDMHTYSVVSSAGQTVCTCTGRANAQQYAALLNRAYELGYKEGYRAAKRSAKGLTDR